MKRFLMMIFIAVMSCTSAFAITSRDVESAGFSKLSSAQQAVIISNVEHAASKVDNTVISVEKVDQWADIGTKVAKMFGGAAKELNVAVNEFAVTPLGYVTTALIVWKFIGSALVHVFGGVLMLTVGISFIIWMVRRGQTVNIEYDMEKTDIFGRSRRKSLHRSGLNSGEGAGYMAAAAAVIIASMVAMFSF